MKVRELRSDVVQRRFKMLTLIPLRGWVGWRVMESEIRKSVRGL